MIRIAVFGCGYSGAKHGRAFNELPSARLRMVADPSAARRAHIESTYRVKDNATHSVAIATPVSTHYRLAREGLLAGTALLVEKPIVASAAEAREPCILASSLNRVLMVGHAHVL